MRVGVRFAVIAVALAIIATLIVIAASPASTEFPAIAFDHRAAAPGWVVTNVDLPENAVVATHQWPFELPDMKLSQLLPPARIRRVRVVRYSTGVFKSPRQVERTLRNLWQSPAEAPSSAIDWAEPTFWTVDALVEFRNGKMARLITDSLHTCAQDVDGKFWFFRTRPHK